MKTLKQKNILIFVLFFIVGVGIALPVVNAQAAIHIFGGTVSASCKATGDCNFCDVLAVVYNIGNFIFSAMIGIALILFLFGSTGLIVNWGNAEMIANNKKLLINTIVGVVIIMLAWILVDAILFMVLGVDTKFFGNDGFWWTGPICKS